MAKSKDYPYIRLWGVYNGWSGTRIGQGIRLARRTDAPDDAMYRVGTVWVRFSDMTESLRRHLG